MKPSEFVEKRTKELEDKVKKDGHTLENSIMAGCYLQAIIEYLDSQWDIRKDPDYGEKKMGI